MKDEQPSQSSMLLDQTRYGELDREATIRKYRIVRLEGGLGATHKESLTVQQEGVCEVLGEIEHLSLSTIAVSSSASPHRCVSALHFR